MLIKPSKKSVERIREKLRDKWTTCRGHEVSQVMRELNPVIRGWANYFRIGVSKRTFSALDHWMVHKTIRHAKYAHPMKPKRWWKARYFGRLNPEKNDRWVFGDKATGHYLLRFSWSPIERHILIRGNASPDDASLKDYWRERNLAKAKDLRPSREKIARMQKGLCRACGDSLFNDEELHVHHRKPKSEGGGNGYDNLEMVHLFCHQQIHAGHRLCPQHVQSRRNA